MNARNLDVQNIDEPDQFKNNQSDYQDNRYQRRFQTSGLESYKNQNNLNRDRSDQSLRPNNFNPNNYNNQGFKTQNIGRPDTGGRKGFDKFSKTSKNLQKKIGKNQNASQQIDEDDDDENVKREFGKVKREMIGDKSVKSNLFRDLCFQFQLIGANFQKVTTNIDKDQKNDQFDQRTLVDQINTNLKNQNDENLLNQCLKDFKVKSQRHNNFIKLSKWLDRLHLEMDKFLMMQRLFLLLQRRIIRHNCSFTQFLQKQRDIIRKNNKFDKKIQSKYDELFKDDKIAAPEFFKILEKLGIIRGNNLEDQTFCIDEYGILNEDLLQMMGLDIQVLKEQEKTETIENKDDIKETNEQQNEDHKQQLIEVSKKKIDSTYIRIDELEQDYLYFQSSIFPKIEEQVIVLICNFCINAKISPRRLFFQRESEKQEEEAGKDNDESDKDEKKENEENKEQNVQNENKKSELNYKSFVDDLDLYYIADLIKIFENQEYSYTSDYSKIFQIFALKASNSLNEKKVQFAYIYTRLMKIIRERSQQIQNEILKIEQDPFQYSVENLYNYLIFSNIEEYHKGSKNLEKITNNILRDDQIAEQYSYEIQQQLQLIQYDQELEVKMIKDLKQQLLRFFANELYNKKTKIEFDKIFENIRYPKFENLFQILNQSFNTHKFQLFGDENLKLICWHHYNSQNQYMNNNQNQNNYMGQNFDIQMDLFKTDVEKEYHILIMRENIIEKFSGALRSLGFEYDTIFQKILGIRNIEKAVISKEQLYQAFVLLEYKISQDEFEEFFNSFTEFIEDEDINVSFIIKQAKIVEKEYLTSKKNKAKRRYKGNIESILKFIGEQISENKLKDFGQILKGQDYQDDGLIKNDNFFQTIESIREFTDGPYCLYNGDIIDIINYMDIKQKGFIDLNQFKETIDEYIYDKNYKIILKSKVKNICDDQILDQNEEIQQIKNQSINKNQIVKPKNLISIVVDLYCGIYNKNLTLQDYLEVNVAQQGQITEDEFVQVIELLNVQINEDLSRQIFQYFSQVQSLNQSDKNDDYLNENSLKTEYLQEQLQQVVQRKCSAKDIKQSLLDQIVIIISKEEIPLLDTIDSFRKDDQNDNDNINYQGVSLHDFQNYILQDYLKLSFIMTENKVQFLSEPYIDPNNQEFVEIDRFILDIKQNAYVLNLNKNNNIKIFDYQQDIEDFKLNQKNRSIEQILPKEEEHAIKVKKGNYVEPLYIQRSEYNTYLTFEERQKLGKSYISQQSSCVPMMKDIMLRTRAFGKSVEEYFKYFGKKMPHGLTELIPDQFRLAVKSLSVPWAENLSVLNLVLNSLDQDDDNEEKGTIDMQEIAKGIIDSQYKTIQFYENEYLEKLFNYMDQNNQFKLLKELLNFLNFNRDYSCSIEQFKNLFHDNLKIPEGCLEDWQINIIMYRYSFQKQDSQFLRVSFIQLFVELLDRKKGFKFDEQIYIKMISDLYKCMKCTYPLENYLSRFFERKGDSRTNQISEKNFIQACIDLKFDKLYSLEQIKKLLSFLSQTQDTQSQFHNQRQVSTNLQKFGYMTGEQLFQEIVNQVFIQSKRTQLKQNALTIFTDVDELDGAKDGYITVEQFVATVKTIIGKSSISNVDLEFLSQKYRNMNSTVAEDLDKVYYKFFYQDYQELLDNGVHIQGIEEINEPNIVKESEQLYVEIPQKFLIFYENILKWIQKQKDRQLTDKLCSLLVEIDESKNGFLTNRQFDECFQAIGMQLSKKQVGQATYCLHQDDQGRYSFHELINHIFGPAKLLETKVRYGLQSSYIENISNQSEKQFQQIQISQLLQNQMSFKFNELLKSQKVVSDGSNMLLENELYKCISQNDIILNSLDKTALSIYFKMNKNRTNKTISFNDLFVFYNIDDRVYKLFSAIKHFFKDAYTHKQANSFLKANEYYFDDFLMFLQMVHFDTSIFDQKLLAKDIVIDQKNLDAKVQYKNLFDLFEVLREEKPFLLKEQIISLFNITKMIINDEENEDRIEIRKQKSMSQDKNMKKKQNQILQSKIDSTLKIFEKFILKDKQKEQTIKEIQDQFMPEDQFKIILTQLKFKIDDLQSQDIITNRFMDKKQQLVNIVNLKRFLEIPITNSVSTQKIRKQNSLEKEQKNKKKETILQKKDSLRNINLNDQTKDLLLNVQQFLLQNNKIDINKVFKEMDKNGSNHVDQKEFISYFIKIKDKNASQNKNLSELDKKINEKNLQSLFQALDSDKSNSLDLVEFGIIIKHVENLNKQIIQNVGDETSQILDLDIDRLFRRVDTNHNGLVDADELYQLFKPLRPGKISLAEVQQIIKMYDKNNDGVIGPEEFQIIVKKEIIQDLTNSSKYFGDYKKIFKAKDSDNDNKLTVQEFSQVIFDLLNCINIKQNELQCFIQLIDVEQNQKISIDDFFTIIQNQGKIKFVQQDEEQIKMIQKCIFEIRKSMSLNLFEYFSFFGEQQLPTFFEPSFLQDFLEKQHQHMPSDGLIQQTLNKMNNIKDFSDKNIEKQLTVRNKSCFKLKLFDMEHVPTPISVGQANGISLQNVLKREVRILMFDDNKSEFISNTYIIPASASENGQAWNFKLSGAIEQATEFTLKYDQENIQDIQIIIELVMTIRQDDKNGKEYQVTNGWASIPLSQIQISQNIMQIKLLGGSPSNLVEIDKNQVKNKEKKKAGIASLFNNKKKEKDEDFYISIQSSAVDSVKLTLIEKVYYYYLPDCFIVNQGLLGMISAVQIHSSTLLQNDFIVNYTKKALDFTDINILMSKLWKDYLSIESMNLDNKTQLEELIQKQNRSLKILIQEIFTNVLENKEFELDSIYPTRSSSLVNPLGFQMIENKFNQILIANIMDTPIVSENEKIKKTAKEALQKCEKKKEQLEKQLKLIPQKPKPGLKGEGIDFNASGQEQFSLGNLMESQENTSSNIQQLLKKHKGAIDIIK